MLVSAAIRNTRNILTYKKMIIYIGKNIFTKSIIEKFMRLYLEF